MTSGIPGYNRLLAMLTAYAKNPKRNYMIVQLIAYVYPENNPSAPPPTTGYDYSNTNYLLAELIIERTSGHSYASELERRFFPSEIGLNDTTTPVRSTARRARSNGLGIFLQSCR